MSNTMAQVWNLSFHLYEKKMKFGIPLFVVGFLASLFPTYPTVHQLAQNSAAVSPSAVATPLSFLILTICFLVNVFFMGTVYHQMNGVLLKEPYTYRQSMRFMRSKYLTLLLADVLFMISMIVGALFFAIPAFILFIFLIPYIPIVLFNHKNAFSAYGLSFKLVWGNWWRTFILFFVPLIVMIIVVFFVSLIGGILQVALHGSRIVHGIVEGFLDAILIPYMVALMMAIWNDLTKRAEARSSKI